MNIKGTVTQELKEVSGVAKSGKPWRKKEYVMQIEGLHPKNVCFAVMNDNIDKFAIEVGKVYDVDIDIESHEFSGKWYHSVLAWKVSPSV